MKILIEICAYEDEYRSYKHFEKEIEWNYLVLPRMNDWIEIEDILPEFFELNPSVRNLCWDVDFIIWQSFEGTIRPKLSFRNEFEEAYSKDLL